MRRIFDDVSLPLVNIQYIDKVLVGNIPNSDLTIMVEIRATFGHGHYDAIGIRVVSSTHGVLADQVFRFSGLIGEVPNWEKGNSYGVPPYIEGAGRDPWCARWSGNIRKDQERQIGTKVSEFIGVFAAAKK